MAMYPPFFETLKNLAPVKSIFGTSPRIFPHGIADQNTLKPYAVFQIITGFPANYLGDLPDNDSYTVQVDVYALTAEAAANGAQAIRNGIEPVAYVTAWRGQFKDIDTNLFRYSFDVDFNTPR